MLQKSILPLLLFISMFCGAQDINGIWKGKLVMAPGACFPVYNIELQIEVAGSRITGTAYHFSDSLNYVRKNLKEFIKPTVIVSLYRKTESSHLKSEKTVFLV